MASVIVLKAGVAESVYDDRFLPIFRALGLHMTVARASEVEYEESSCEWVAVSKVTGKVIARGPVRAQVIADEVSYLERGLRCR